MKFKEKMLSEGSEKVGIMDAIDNLVQHGKWLKQALKEADPNVFSDPKKREEVRRAIGTLAQEANKIGQKYFPKFRA